MSETHPGWLAVGSEVEAVRRLGRSVSWRRIGKVVRHTKTSVIVDFGHGAPGRFAAKWGDYHMVPRYIDYTTTLEPTPATLPR